MLNGSTGKVAHYTAGDVAAEHRGWVVGPFVTLPDGSALTDKFEVKTETLKKGAARTEWASEDSGQAWEMILSGTLKLTFLIDGKEEEVVLNAGGCSVRDNTVPHKWEALDDTTYIFVRIRSYDK